MTSVHQCDVMAESARYILVDEYIMDNVKCETYMYEIQTTRDKADGDRVHWLHCPYCGEKLIKESING